MLLTNILLVSYFTILFSTGEKNALARPINKKKDRQNKENYRPVSILNGFPKVCERFINDSMLPIIQIFLSIFISAYRKRYSANHVLISLIENWKKSLNNSKIVGAIFMYLIKSFWLNTSWFTYNQNGSLWFQWEFSYFFVFIREPSNTIREH